MAKVKSDYTQSVPTGKQLSSSVTEEAIARRAYELYLRRAGEDGRDIDDWLEAERQLRSEQHVKRDNNAHLGRRGTE
jgi:outer membrane protein TolC